MPEEPTTPKQEGIEVEVPVMKKGTTQFMTTAAFKNPAPDKLKRVLRALNYFCAGLVTTVGATDLFSGTQAKVISFILGIVILASGAIELSTGVKSDTEK